MTANEMTVALAVIDDGPLDSRLRTQKTALSTCEHEVHFSCFRSSQPVLFLSIWL